MDVSDDFKPKYFFLVQNFYFWMFPNPAGQFLGVPNPAGQFLDVPNPAGQFLDISSFKTLISRKLSVSVKICVIIESS